MSVLRVALAPRSWVGWFWMRSGMSSGVRIVFCNWRIWLNVVCAGWWGGDGDGDGYGDGEDNGDDESGAVANRATPSLPSGPH